MTETMERAEKHVHHTEPPPARPKPVALVTGAGRDLAVLVATFVAGLVAFTVCTVLVSAGLGLAIVGVGLVVLAAGLVVAGQAALVSRWLLAHASAAVAGTTPRPVPRSFRAWLGVLTRPQAWRDLLHVLVMFPVSTFSFSVALTWVAGGLGGVTYGLWSQWLPADTIGLGDLIGDPGRAAEVGLHTVIGAGLLVTTPVVPRGLIRLHAAIAATLLTERPQPQAVTS